MTDTRHEPAHTGLLLMDPYNDFLSEGGKAWPMLKEVATEVGLLDNLRAVVAAARAAGIQIFVVPHRRWREGNHANWNYLNAYQADGLLNQMFADGTWGGDWHPDFVPQANDVVVHEHWAQSGFANTDLDLQDPKQFLFFTRTANGRRAGKQFLARLKERTDNRDKAISLKSYFAQLDAIHRWGLERPHNLSVIRQPVLVANGENDRMVLTPNSLDLARRLPDSDLVIYPDAGHGGIFQFHDEFVTKALAFLER